MLCVSQYVDAFGVGGSRERIDTIDLDGVLLAAIKVWACLCVTERQNV